MKTHQSPKTKWPSSKPKLHFTQTKDNVKISIFEYKPDEPTEGALPVMLIHGLGSSHRSFDIFPEVSLAKHLASKGFFVYSVNLRGSSPSAQPNWANRKAWNWDLDTFIDQDIPAAIDWICKRTLSQRLHWIGHSMGGIAYYVLAAKNLTSKIASGLTIGASLDYSHSGSSYEMILKLSKWGHLIPYFPLGLTYSALSPFVGRMNTRFEKFLVYPKNIEPTVFRKLMSDNFHSIPTPLLLQLTTLFQHGGVKSRNGDKYLELLKKSKNLPPTLAIAGDMDLQCPPEAVEKTIALFPKENSALKTFGLGYGNQTHYGHFDLICGKAAPLEVWPEINAWLEKNS